MEKPGRCETRINMTRISVISSHAGRGCFHQWTLHVGQCYPRGFDLTLWGRLLKLGGIWVSGLDSIDKSDGGYIRPDEVQAWTPHRAVTKRTGDPHGDPPGSHAAADDRRIERGLWWRPWGTEREWPSVCVPLAFHRFIRGEAARAMFQFQTCYVFGG